MNKNGSNWVKAYIIDVLPCITVAIYVLAFIYNMSFFSVFNINSVQYISLSEMLLSIIEPLVAFVFISLIVSWMGLWWFTSYLPQFNVLEAERRNGKKHWIIPYRFLRIIIKFRKTKIYLFLKKIYDKTKRSEIKIKEKQENKRKALEKEKDYHSWHAFSVFFVFVLLSFYLYINLQKKGLLEKGMMGASIGLSLPLVLFVTMSIIGTCVAIVLFDTDSRKIRKYKVIEIVEMVILYYCFAITVFHISGKDYGKYVKEHDIATFEIKTSDGNQFCNYNYRYINNMNDKIFLLEKKTGNNVILNQESIVFMKVIFKDESNHSIIVKVIDLFVEKSNKLFEKVEELVKTIDNACSG